MKRYSSYLKRNPNIELLRIAAMSMIVLGHFIFIGAMNNIAPGGDGNFGPINFKQFTLVLLYVLCTPGVNLYALISGYYGINLKWKSILSLWLLCIFYNVSDLFINHIDIVSIKSIIQALTISRSINWFFPAYFWLLIFSPILNTSFLHFSRIGQKVICALFLVLTCVCGRLFGNGNSSGCDVLQLVAIYIVGMTIRTTLNERKIPKKKVLVLLLVTVLAFCLTVILMQTVLHKDTFILFTHNSVFVITLSVLIFCLFLSINIRGVFINRISQQTVAAIFLQTISWGFVESIIGKYYNGYPVLLLIGVLVVASAAILVTAVLIENIRKPIASHIEDKVANMLDNWIRLDKAFDETNQ